MAGGSVAVVAGLLSGLLSGLFGVGGALITTPVVRLALGRPELVAVGTPLAIVVPTVLAGVVGHLRQGTVDVRSGLVLGLSGAPFAVLGALGTTVVGGGPILLATAAVLAYVAARTWSGTGEATATRPHKGGTSVPWLVSIGATAGALSGLMGLGGGFVIVPALSGLLGYPFPRAAGTSLVAITVLSTPGAIAHALLGNVEPGLALAITVGVVPGALAGARLAKRVHGTVLRRGFAVFLLAGAFALGANEIAVMARG